MPPRPRGSGGGAVAGGTLAMRAQAGQQQQQQRKQQQQQPPAQQPQQQQDVLYNTNNYKNNLSVVYFLRIYMTVVAGAAAGALGVTGWRGFALYLLSQAAVAPLVVLKAGGRTAKYFPGWNNVVLEHALSSTAILSYILFWMVAYNLGHVF